MVDIRRGSSLFVMAVIVIASLTGCVGQQESDSSGPTSTAVSTPPDVDKGTPTAAPIAPEAVIVFASMDDDGQTVSVSGYVAGVIENDGDCTYVFTGPGSTQQVASTGVADAGQTSCGVAQLNADALSSGAWDVVLEYSSPKITTTSAPTVLEIP